MNNVLKRIIVLAIIYVGTAAGLIYFGGRDKEDLTTQMSEASLPVVYLSYDSITINELHGYTGEMNALSMRDSITPLTEDNIIPITIDTYGTQVDQLTYEVRSLNGDRLVQDGEREDFVTKDGTLKLDLKLQKLMDEDTEYVLRLGLVCADSTVYYYTRIMETEDCNVKESIEFVTGFHDMTLNPTDQTYLASFMEPDETEENTTLQRTTIHSNLEQLTWASFEGTPVTDPIPTIKEVNSVYNVITLNYVMSSVGENGELEYYNVEEYYRVRRGLQRMYMLNFERTMEEIFRGENQSFADDAVQIGICSPNIKYYSNGSGKNVCFVQEGELWTFGGDTGRLTQAFSFRGFEGIDARENYDQHDIQVQNIDEEGNIDFVVYGYMNRGDHEGQTGISVCRYNASSNAVEEQLFVPSEESYQIMKEKLCRLMYIGDNGHFYLAAGGNIYKIDLTTKEYSKMVEGLTEDAFRVSEDGRYVAWTVPEEDGFAETLHVLDLEEETVTEIKAEEGSYIKPLTFMGTDVVYGLAAADEVNELETLNIFPMYKVCIADSTQESHPVLKTYEKSNYYVTDASVEGNTIYLGRVFKDGSVYLEAEEDTIVNQEEGNDALVTLTSYTSEEKQLQYQLQMPEGNRVRSVQLVTPTWVVGETDPVLELEMKESGSCYYAFAKGEVLLGTDNLREAIGVANENMGVVVDEAQQYVWKRAKKTEQDPLTLAMDVPGDTPAEKAVAILQSAAGMSVNTGMDLRNLTGLANAMNEMTDTVKWLDLSGCRLEEMLYYVSQGTPVMAYETGEQVSLIVGYDEDHVTLLDPVSGDKSELTMEDAVDRFDRMGNIYMTYIER